MRLHPAPDVIDCDYQWYANRIQAMSAAREGSNLYTTENGWTEESQKCFKWLATVDGTKLPFRIIRWKVRI